MEGGGGDSGEEAHAPAEVGGGGGGLELEDGVMGDGVRTVPLSFKATVELIYFVGQVQVVVGGFRLKTVICLSPFQTEPESFVEDWS